MAKRTAITTGPNPQGSQIYDPQEVIDLGYKAGYAYALEWTPGKPAPAALSSQAEVGHKYNAEYVSGYKSGYADGMAENKTASRKTADKPFVPMSSEVICKACGANVGPWSNLAKTYGEGCCPRCGADSAVMGLEDVTWTQDGIFSNGSKTAKTASKTAGMADETPFDSSLQYELVNGSDLKAGDRVWRGGFGEMYEENPDGPAFSTGIAENHSGYYYTVSDVTPDGIVYTEDKSGNTFSDTTTDLSSRKIYRVSNMNNKKTADLGEQTFPKRCTSCGQKATKFASNDGQKSNGYYVCDDCAPKFAEGRTMMEAKRSNRKIAGKGNGTQWSGGAVGDPHALDWIDNGGSPGPAFTPTRKQSKFTHSNGVVEIEDDDPDFDTNPNYATCGTCGRTWDDSVSTGWTPAPSGRCPFEYEHEYDDDDYDYNAAKRSNRKIADFIQTSCAICGFDIEADEDDEDDEWMDRGGNTYCPSFVGYDEDGIPQYRGEMTVKHTPYYGDYNASKRSNKMPTPSRRRRQASEFNKELSELDATVSTPGEFSDSTSPSGAADVANVKSPEQGYPQPSSSTQEPAIGESPADDWVEGGSVDPEKTAAFRRRVRSNLRRAASRKSPKSRRPLVRRKTAGASHWVTHNPGDYTQWDYESPVGAPFAGWVEGGYLPERGEEWIWSVWEINENGNWTKQVAGGGADTMDLAKQKVEQYMGTGVPGSTASRKTAFGTCPVCGGDGFLGNDICMDCVKARASAARDGKCHCGRRKIPGAEVEVWKGGRRYIPCERCLGTIRQTGSKAASRKTAIYDDHLCDVCGKPISDDEWDSRHEGGGDDAEDIINQWDEDGVDYPEGIDSPSAVFHDDCCPFCNGLKTAKTSRRKRGRHAKRRTARNDNSTWDTGEVELWFANDEGCYYAVVEAGSPRELHDLWVECNPNDSVDPTNVDWQEVYDYFEEDREDQ